MIAACRILLLTWLCFLTACTIYPTRPTANAPETFKPTTKSDLVEFLSPEALALLEAPSDAVYRLGAGDVLSLQVWGRPELSGRFILGPDGIITVPVVGPVQLNLLTREEAAQQVKSGLLRYYDNLSVVMGVEQYTSNKVTVLGRVQSPGQQVFESQPTLLEVLARAGSLPVIDKQATLTRCAIFRGRNKIIWVDLKRLLNGGEVAYNLRMMKGDLVYIPDSSDTMVYVMGEVYRPGAYRLTPDMSLMDALMQAGGPNDNASAKEIGIYRASKQAIERVELRNLLTADKKVNFALEEGDVVFVPKSTIAEFGYVTRQLAAGLSFLTLTSLLGSK